jgi:methylglyoxal synthase
MSLYTIYMYSVVSTRKQPVKHSCFKTFIYTVVLISVMSQTLIDPDIHKNLIRICFVFNIPLKDTNNQYRLLTDVKADIKQRVL